MLNKCMDSGNVDSLLENPRLLEGVLPRCGV